MSQTKPLSSPSQQDSISLQLALAMLGNASREEFSEAMEQLPKEKRREMAIALLVNADFAEKIEVFKQLSLEQMGEITMAIAQVWQEGD